MDYRVNDKLKVVHPVANVIYNVEQVSINKGKLMLKCIESFPLDDEDKRYIQTIDYIDKLLEDKHLILNP